MVHITVGKAVKKETRRTNLSSVITLPLYRDAAVQHVRDALFVDLLILLLGRILSSFLLHLFISFCVWVSFHFDCCCPVCPAKTHTQMSVNDFFCTFLLNYLFIYFCLLLQHHRSKGFISTISQTTCKVRGFLNPYISGSD